jgi:amidase
MKASDWSASSIMAKRGIASGKVGRELRSTDTEQGAHHFVYGPYAKPIMTLSPGDTLVVDTEDAFSGKITSETDKPSEKLKYPFMNPQSGPFAVSGAEPGDCIAVLIEAIETRGDYGATALIPEFGGLVGTSTTALLNPPLPEKVKLMRIDATGVHFSDKIVLPYEPFIGTIGVSPQLEAISSLVPDYYGGNMDLPDVCPGSIIYLPVNIPGAHLFVGDCHAAQGDGELTGVAVEQRATVRLKIDLIKGWSFAWPRLETKDFIMTIGSARPMEDAARIAYRELTRWMAAEYGFDELDAYMLLSQAGRIRLGNMVDPKYTLGASILKKYLVV